MLITKFNKMIRNKFLWAFFAIIVCVAFVGGSLQISGCGKNAGGSFGMIDDKPISYNEFTKARLFEMGFRKASGLSDSETKELDSAAWRRLATLKYAEKIGVICTRPEIDSLITSDPRFQVNGVFDPVQYEGAVQKELGITTALLEEYMGQEIVLNKMMSIARNMVLTPPSELADKLTRLTDIVEADYAFITNKVDLEKIRLSDDETKSYFEENIDLFRIPEKMNVQYVNFPISNYISEVTITEDNALDYYDDHISDYSSRDTNDELVTVAFIDVKEEITAKLIREQASYLARDTATEFVMDLMPDRDGMAAPLETVLTKAGLALHTSDYFSIFERVNSIDAGYEFNRAAFDLIPSDPERRISDAVVGTSNVYILIAGDKIESRLPTFDEVKNDAEPFAKQRKASEMFDKQTHEIRTDAIAKIGQGKNLADALKSEDIEVFSSDPFSVYSDITNEVKFSEVLVPAVIGMDKGEVSELIPTQDGYMLIHLKSRTEGDLLSGELLRPQLVAAISKYRSSIVFYEMQKKLVEDTVTVTDDKTAEPIEEPTEE